MADRRNAVLENVEGSFFVDATCIDCDTCRQLAPDIFGETGEFSFVKAQPGDPAGNAPLCMPWSLAPPGRSVHPAKTALRQRYAISLSRSAPEFPTAVSTRQNPSEAIPTSSNIPPATG
jgi:hypothetical protein